MWTVVIAVLVAVYAISHSKPVTECSEIITAMEAAQRDAIPFPVTWSMSDKVACVFSSVSQRDEWIASIEIYRFNVAKLEEMSRQKESP